MVFGASCKSKTETTVNMLNPPSMMPTHIGDMSVSAAEKLLAMQPPVKVANATSFESGKVDIAIQDAQGKIFGLQRSSWGADKQPRFVIMNSKGEPDETLEWNDPRLKALAALSLNWVDQKYSKTEQNRIFAGKHLEEKPFDIQKEYASEVLWLFRKEKNENR